MACVSSFVHCLLLFVCNDYFSFIPMLSIAGMLLHTPTHTKSPLPADSIVLVKFGAQAVDAHAFAFLHGTNTRLGATTSMSHFFFTHQHPHCYPTYHQCNRIGVQKSLCVCVWCKCNKDSVSPSTVFACIPQCFFRIPMVVISY